MAREREERRAAADRREGEIVFGLPRPDRRLAALASSALALPGIAGSARADAPIERAEATGSFSYYREDDLPNDKFLDDGVGSRERYEVFTGQLRFDLPVSERVDIGAQFLYEDMSGASPWYVALGSSAENLQVMSGATIEDRRFDMTVDADFYLDNGKDTFSAGFSTERDYDSIHVGIGSERSFNDKNTTFSISGAFSKDWVEPTDAEDFGYRISSGEKWSIDFFVGLSQILSRSTVAQVTVNYKHSDGYLSDPYKAIQNVDGGFGILSDNRPDEKDQGSILARLRQHIEPIDAAIHLDYRFYADSWDITSHTVDLGWYQTFTDWFMIAPSFRYYTQSKADFYDPLLPVGVIPEERSSDFRLSPYGSLSGRVKVEFNLEDIARYNAPMWLDSIGIGDGLDLIVALSYERYFSDGAFALVSVADEDEAPGLVDFQVGAITISGRF